MSNILPVIIDAENEPEITENSDEKIVNSENDRDEEEMFDEDDNVEEEVVEVKPKVKIEQDVIFQGKAPAIKPVAKKKRVMDEAKLEQLKKARAKANATRSANKEAKLRAKEEAKKAKEEAKKELEELTQQKIAQKTEQYVEQRVEKIKQQVDKDPVIIQKSSVSFEDIEKIVGGAISKYDNERIARKEEKKKKQAEEQKHAKINATIKRAQGRQLAPNEQGFFDNCFG